jgi:transcriptional regulator with XRE-family HTH domain
MMQTIHMSELSENIKRLRTARQMSPEDLGAAVGMSRTYFRKLESSDFASPSYKVIKKLSEFFGVPIGDIYGDPSPRDDNIGVATSGNLTPSFAKLHVRWRAQAGTWVEIDQDQSEIEEHLIPVSTDFPQVTRFLVRIYGDSMNKTPLQDGAIAICLDFEELGKPPTDGMIVVVQRSEDGGATIETTVKRLHVFNDRWELRPESTNARHEIITIWKNAGDEKEVKILGLVDGVYYSRKSLR